MESITKRLDRVQKVPSEFLVESPPVPISVKIELSARCNYRCTYCALVDRPQNGADMDFNLFKGMTSEMRDLGVEEIGPFFIGESFTNPWLLVDSISWLKEGLGFSYVFLTSNASLASPEYVNACMASGLDSLKWSCNAADKAQFAKMMGVGGRLFDKAASNIREAFGIRSSGGFGTKPRPRSA